MTIGETISAARKRKNVTLENLGCQVGLMKSSLSAIENDKLKKPLDHGILISIAEALDAPDILIKNCEQCPVRQHIMRNYYPELRLFRKDPEIITKRLFIEMQKAVDIAEELSETYLNVCSTNDPEYRKAFNQVIEQILRVESAVETLKFEMILNRLCTLEEIEKVLAG